MAPEPAARRSNAATAPPSMWIDAQCDIADPDPQAAEDSPPSRSMVELMRESALTAISMTMAEPGEGRDRYAATMASLAGTSAWLLANPDHVMLVQRGRDLTAAAATRRLGFIYNLQDSALVGEDMDRIGALKLAGLRVMQLTYNRRNLAGSGCLEAEDLGLTEWGRDIVRAIGENRIVLDLSHAGRRTLREGIEASGAPAVVTHAGCRALADFPRNVDDDSLRALAAKGGVFGVFLMPFLAGHGMAKQSDLLRHMNHAVNVCGEEHVGIGSDGSVSAARSDAAAREAHRKRYQMRVERGFASPGEGPERLNFVEGYNRPDRFARLADDLENSNWSARRIELVLGGNFARVYAEVWGT